MRSFERLVGRAVIGSALMGGALVVFAVVAIEEPDTRRTTGAALFGNLNVVYSVTLPHLSTVVTAIGLALLLPGLHGRAYDTSAP